MESLATDAPQTSSAAERSPGTGPAERRAGFWEKYPGLVWSNREAGDAVRIRAALLRPLFPVLLDIAATFGLERLEQEWAILCADPETDTRRAEPQVSRILKNIRRGYDQAHA